MVHRIMSTRTINIVTMKVAIVLCLIGMAMAMPKSRPTHVPGEYILRLDESFIKNNQQEKEVVSYLKKNFGMDLIKSMRVHRLKFLHLKGDDEFLGQIGALRGVRYIERNAIGYVDQCAEQPSPGTWGLDRVDQVQGPVPYDDPLSDAATYVYGEDMGDGVSVYVLDTGIEIEHENFDGRARWGYNDPNMPSEDNHSHGTHCAGTVGARSYGVAKSVELVAVKVINQFGSGSTDQFLGGMDWIMSDHVARSPSETVFAKSVISISLGYSPQQSIDDSIQAAADLHISTACSAGNSDADACGQSPARAPVAITTGY